MATTVAVGAGVAISDLAPTSEDATAATRAAAGTSALAEAAVESRTLRSSRAEASRQAAELKPQRTRKARAALTPLPKPTGKLWAVKDLDLRLTPAEGAEVDGVFESGKQLNITGVEQDGYAQVLSGSAVRWVTAEYLSEEKEVAPEEMPVGTQECDRDLGSQSGLTGGAVTVWDSVCALFPEIQTIGGFASRGEHGGGKAIDIMTSDFSVGDRIADYLRANSGEFGLSNIIWKQQIWSAQRGGEGWRGMSNRGSATANHMDHVHVLVN